MYTLQLIQRIGMAKKEIFICFSTHGGEDLANHLYKFCKDIGYEVFLSSETIRLGHNWPNERDKALRECEKFIFIATADVAISYEVAAYEIRKAKELRKHIIPCKHTNIKNWSQLKKFEIEYNQGTNFHTPHELVRELSGELMVIPQQRPSM